MTCSKLTRPRGRAPKHEKLYYIYERDSSAAPARGPAATGPGIRCALHALRKFTSFLIDPAAEGAGDLLKTFNGPRVRPWSPTSENTPLHYWAGGAPRVRASLHKQNTEPVLATPTTESPPAKHPVLPLNNPSRDRDYGDTNKVPRPLRAQTTNRRRSFFCAWFIV